MRVLVCGGRNYNNRDLIYETLDRIHQGEFIKCVIEGDATGADYHGGQWAKAQKIAERRIYPADWLTHGKKAGPIRNQQMIDEGKPDIVVAFPGGSGTADMVRRAKQHGLKVIEVSEENQ